MGRTAHAKLTKLKTFVVGAGALGCEPAPFSCVAYVRALLHNDAGGQCSLLHSVAYDSAVCSCATRWLRLCNANGGDAGASC